MESVNKSYNNSSNTSLLSRIFPVVLFIVALVGLYYIYKYFFSAKYGTEYPLIKDSKVAKFSESDMYTGGVSINSQGKLPVLYEGAEFSISTWIYINDWNFRLGKNKHVISLGDDTADIIRIYLGGFKSKLNVQLNTDNNLAGTTRDAVFTTMQTDSDIGDNLYSANSCDLPEIQIQRWVNIVVAVNGKTVDVYLDGKLSRSCVLPKFYKSSNPQNYTAHLLAYGGFGGIMSKSLMYDYALNPEIVYKQYMEGPDNSSLFDWLYSMLIPKVEVSVSFSQA